MDYNLNDPNLDFDIEQEALINALKGARVDKRALAPELTGSTWAASGSGLGGVGAALTRLAGNLDERRLTQENRALAGEQQNRYDALQNELATPAARTRTVLKQALQAGPTEEGGSLPDISTSVQEQIPENEYRMAENQRRMGVAQKMSRLPMARGMADELWKKGIAFPERMMELEAKQIEVGNLAAQRAAEREAQARRDEAMRRDIAAMNDSTRRYAIDSKGPSPAEVKKGEADAAKVEGRQSLDDTLYTIRSRIEALDKLDGLPSTEKGSLSNIGSSIASSGVGQVLGRALGTKEQAIRDELGSLQMQLLSSIKEATGMSSKAIDSNAELKLWLASLGDSSMTKEARLQIVKNIEDKYLKGGAARAPNPAPSSATGGASTMVTDPSTGQTFVRGANGKWYSR